jgi:hypothetical protein
MASETHVAGSHVMPDEGAYETGYWAAHDGLPCEPPSGMTDEWKNSFAEGHRRLTDERARNERARETMIAARCKISA